MATLPPKPFPKNGTRALSPNEILRRAKALNCTNPKNSEPTCQSQINVGIFFDGTGNNRDNDYITLPPGLRKHSNIVRLFNIFREDAAGGFFRYYIAGVGTPFSPVNDAGAPFGGPFAWNGEDRIIWALLQLINTPNLFVHGQPLIPRRQAGIIANNLASSVSIPWARRKTLGFWQDKLRESINGKKPSIEQINLYVFGFSRGSAQARAFSNWLSEICIDGGGGRTFAGIPIRYGFLGIFDTVASVGIPNSLVNAIMEGHQSWADGNMEISPNIEQCVHYVAGHEVRASFPLDSVRVKEKYPENAREVMYPGSHSDLGGGYAPNDLGISPAIDEMYAKIPGSDMYKEACTAGVPLKPWASMTDVEKLEFSPSVSTIKSYNAYITSSKIGPGPVDEVHRKHMSLYLRYRYKYRNNNGEMPFYKKANSKHRRYIDRTSETISTVLGRLITGKKPKDPDYSLSEAIRLHEKVPPLLGMGLPGLKRIAEVAKEIENARLSPEIEHFLGNYVHDSMAGFIEMGGRATDEFFINDQGIMRFRKIFTENG